MNYLLSALLGLAASIAISSSVEAQESGETVYNDQCASCHSAPTDLRTPARAALGSFTPTSIYNALTQGIMQPQGAALTEVQRLAVIEFLTGRAYNAARVERLSQCESAMTAPDLASASNWNGWANGEGSARHQSAAGTRLNASNVDALELAWTFGFEDASNSRAQPTVVDGVVYLGSNSGNVHALDLQTGCAYWTFVATSEVRGALSLVYSDELARTLVVGADVSNRVFALDAMTGEKLWHADVDTHPLARSTGSVLVADDKVFVPVSSAEVAIAGNPAHACCTFRGSMAAYSLRTGEQLWHAYVMDEATQVGTNSAGSPVFAPSGAPIWGAPTADLLRNRVYVGTGQNYTRPASATSDSVIAFNMDTGAMDWVLQTTSNDAFTMACTMGRDHPNCPDPGPDLDIGAPVMLVTLSTGKDILVAGSKGGIVFGLDPDAYGRVLWQTRVGRGGPLGGVHWGMSFADDMAYVPVSDRATGGAEEIPRQPGLHAIDLKTGGRIWYSEAPQRCPPDQRNCMDAYSSAATTAADLVLSGSLSGHLFAHAQSTGALLWEYDTRQTFETVNAVPASGGAIDSSGPVVSGDYVLLNSGYATFGQLPGNALLVFKLPD